MRANVSKLLIAISVAFLFGCGTPIHSKPIRFLQAGPDPVEIEGFDGCGTDSEVMDIDPEKPLVVLVHGCNSSSGRFRTLAGVFEAHGQQAICFTYDDRASLEESSAIFAGGLNSLRSHMNNDQLTLLGHSQGGLIARRALVSDRPDQVIPAQGFDFQLVTVSSPFDGIYASSHCSLIGMHIATLGISAFLCRSIAGKKWTEIHSEADFMRKPGALTDGVTSYLKVVTDEKNTCRSYDEDGSCIEDDYVFSVEEQYNTDIDKDERTRNIEVRAGHVEIVGEVGVVPTKLLDVLEKQGVLAPVPIEQKEAVAFKIRALYGAI